jgi:hypothetical protein
VTQSFVVSASGVRVFKNWKDNIVVDAHNPVLTWKTALRRERFSTGKAQGLSRFASQNSEDALTWNFFRTLHLEGMLTAMLATEVPEWRTTKSAHVRVLFWGRDAEGPEGVDPQVQGMLDTMEPWGRGGRRQQTEPDVTLITDTTVVIIEGKLGAIGAGVNAWKRSTPGMRAECQEFVKDQRLDCIESQFDWNRHGPRFYQLLRNWILATALGRRLGKSARLIAVVNAENKNKNGLSHTAEFEAFAGHLPLAIRDQARLVTWQVLMSRVAGSDQKVEALRGWVNGNRALYRET